MQDKTTHHSTVKALRERLDPGNQTLTALDFRHANQKSSETVSDFLRQLEHIYQTAFGRENLSPETTDMLLYRQLHEGLSYSLMESPSVSGHKTTKSFVMQLRRRSGGLLN